MAFKLERESAFSGLRPFTEMTNSENIKEALFILLNAHDSFKSVGIKNSEIPFALAEAEKGKVELRASFGTGKDAGKTLIYSVKLEINGEEKIVSLRLSDTFTELSLHKNGKLSEMMLEEKGKVMHEKYA